MKKLILLTVIKISRLKHHLKMNFSNFLAVDTTPEV